MKGHSIFLMGNILACWKNAVMGTSGDKSRPNYELCAPAAKASYLPWPCLTPVLPKQNIRAAALRTGKVATNLPAHTQTKI